MPVATHFIANVALLFNRFTVAWGWTCENEARVAWLWWLNLVLFKFRHVPRKSTSRSSNKWTHYQCDGLGTQTWLLSRQPRRFVHGHVGRERLWHGRNRRRGMRTFFSNLVITMVRTWRGNVSDNVWHHLKTARRNIFLVDEYFRHANAFHSGKLADVIPDDSLKILLVVCLSTYLFELPVLSPCLKPIWCQMFF